MSNLFVILKRLWDPVRITQLSAIFIDRKNKIKNKKCCGKILKTRGSIVRRNTIPYFDSAGIKKPISLLRDTMRYINQKKKKKVNMGRHAIHQLKKK